MRQACHEGLRACRLCDQETKLIAEAPRQFPPPDEMPGGYVVRGAEGWSVAYVHSRRCDTEGAPGEARSDCRELGEAIEAAWQGELA